MNRPINRMQIDSTIAPSSTYTGKAIEPTIQVSGLPASAYKVQYSANIEVGTAKAEIRATDPHYTGTIIRTFKILPKKAAIAKVKAGKKKLSVKAKIKVSRTGGTKYHLQTTADSLNFWLNFL